MLKGLIKVQNKTTHEIRLFDSEQSAYNWARHEHEMWVIVE